MFSLCRCSLVVVILLHIRAELLCCGGKRAELEHYAWREQGLFEVNLLCGSERIMRQAIHMVTFFM